MVWQVAISHFLSCLEGPSLFHPVSHCGGMIFGCPPSPTLTMEYHIQRFPLIPIVGLEGGFRFFFLDGALRNTQLS